MTKSKSATPTDAPSLREEQAREQIESLARQLENRIAEFEALFNVIPLGMAIVSDTDCKSMRFNPVLARLLGVQPGDRPALPEAGNFQLFDENGNAIPPAGTPMGVSIREGRAVEGQELSLVHRDGGVTRLLAYASPLLDGEGAPRGCIAAFVDITERKRIEYALQASEARFRQLADSIPQLAWTARADGHIYWYNRRWYEYTGTTPEQMLGWGWTQVHDPAVLPAVMERWTACLETGEPFDMEFPLRGANGQFRSFLTRVLPLRDDKERVVQWFGTNTDVAEQRRATDAIRVSEKLFRQLADSAPVMIWIADTSKACTWCNAARLGFSGRTMEQELGSGWADSIHPEDMERCREIYSTHFDARKPFEMDYRLRRHDGAYRWIVDRGVPIFGAEGQFLGYMGGCIDITERKEAEQQREQMLAAERSARAEAERLTREKDEFLATLSHELRTPLNAILGWSHLLRQNGTPGPEKLMQGLDVIERNARTQSQLIEDLLDMSGIISGKVRLNLERLDLSDVIGAALDVVRPSTEARKIRLEAEAPQGKAFVSGDPNRLQQIFWNLLTNAVKFTPAAGRIRVALETVGSYAEVSIADSGKGIAPEFLPKVFERFRQADSSSTRAHGGLGLGLAIVKALSELHGGAVRAESAGEGRGATFTVRLPVVATVPEGLRRPDFGVAEAKASGQVLQGMTVLVVDDDQDARELLGCVLEEQGAVVNPVASAREAIDAIERGRPDLMVSDIGMADMDGYDLIREVRRLGAARGGHIPAIALTAFARPEDRRRALLAGYQLHVAKPVDPNELVAGIASLVCLMRT